MSTSTSTTSAMNVAATPAACPVSQLSDPSTSSSFCIISESQPHFQSCWQNYGSNGSDTEVQMLRQCYPWCELDDEAFGIGSNKSMRIQVMFDCMFTGVDSDEDFEDGPERMRCLFDDLDRKGTMNSSSAVNGTMDAEGQSVGSVVSGSANLGSVVMAALLSSMLFK